MDRVVVADWAVLMRDKTAETGSAVNKIANR